MDEQSRNDRLLWRPGQVEIIEDDDGEGRDRRQPED